MAAESMTDEGWAVWCDFGGVLTPPIDEAAAAIAAEAGVPWPILWAAVGRVAARAGLTGLGPLELGRMSQREWGAQVEAELPRRVVSRVDLGDWGNHWYRGRSINRPLIAELRRLQTDGVAVGLLTNSVAEWEPLRSRMLGGDVDLFVAVVRSHEIGIAKPDPAIFDHADSLRLGTPERTVLIDDTHQNCQAARGRGWRAIHHRATQATISRLRRIFPSDPLHGLRVGASEG
jgi:putative hydrolase of the HAD superfamily